MHLKSSGPLGTGGVSWFFSGMEVWCCVKSWYAGVDGAGITKRAVFAMVTINFCAAVGDKFTFTSLEAVHYEHEYFG